MAARFRSKFVVHVRTIEDKNNWFRESHNFDTLKDAEGYARRAIKRKTVRGLEIYQLVRFENAKH